MTRRQFRRYKQKNLALIQSASSEDRPDWADVDKEEERDSNWRVSFLSQFPWYKGSKKPE